MCRFAGSWQLKTWNLKMRHEATTKIRKSKVRWLLFPLSRHPTYHLTLSRLQQVHFRFINMDGAACLDTPKVATEGRWRERAANQRLCRAELQRCFIVSTLESKVTKHFEKPKRQKVNNIEKITSLWATAGDKHFSISIKGQGHVLPPCSYQDPDDPPVTREKWTYEAPVTSFAKVETPLLLTCLNGYITRIHIHHHHHHHHHHQFCLLDVQVLTASIFYVEFCVSHRSVEVSYFNELSLDRIDSLNHKAWQAIFQRWETLRSRLLTEG